MQPSERSGSMTIPSDMAQAGEVGLRLGEQLRALGVQEAITTELRMAVGEAVANAILHGNREDPRKLVVVEWSVDGGRVSVSVSDEGQGFRPEHVPDPTLDENLLKEHGRGLFLITHLLDEVHHNAVGNQITMVKYLRGSERA